MRRTITCLLCLLPISFLSAQENLRPDVPVALVGGMLLDGYEAEPIHHSVVIFDDGRITAVGQKHNTAIPDNAVVINVAGNVLRAHCNTDHTSNRTTFKMPRHI